MPPQRAWREGGRMGPENLAEGTKRGLQPRLQPLPNLLLTPPRGRPGQLWAARKGARGLGVRPGPPVCACRRVKQEGGSQVQHQARSAFPGRAPPFPLPPPRAIPEWVPTQCHRRPCHPLTPPPLAWCGGRRQEGKMSPDSQPSPHPSPGPKA